MKNHEYTQGCTDDALGQRFSVRHDLLPLDEPDDSIRTCVLCGHRDSFGAIIRTVLRDEPGRVQMRCADAVACIRRRPRR